MSKDEAAAALIAGAQNTTSEFVTVTRKHLLIALGAEEEAEDGTNKPSDIR